MNQILNFWLNIRYSLWFIPTAIVTASMLLAVLAIEADTHISDVALTGWPRVFGASAEGARSVLEVVAGAMITVAGLTFSITILVLSLGASQYTPRIIRTFMGNRPTQTVLGVFLGIFVYCLIVLRAIRGGEDEFIPSIAVAIAIVLALVGVGVLVYFIHHVASSIQASAIASAVADDTIRMIDTLYPDCLDDHPETSRCRSEEEANGLRWFPIGAAKTGYIQTANVGALIDCANRHHLAIKMEKRIGAFVIQGMPIALASPQPKAEVTRAVQAAYKINHYRTVDQDIGVGIRQLVDIALKAMSPAMNDTTTALLCIDYLAAIIAKLAPRCIIPDLSYNEGTLKVITTGPGFAEFLNEAFEEIRNNAKENPVIYIRLLQALQTLGGYTKDEARKNSIIVHIEQVFSYAKRHLSSPDQIERVEAARRQALDGLQVHRA